jgi:hypothetical protein
MENGKTNPVFLKIATFAILISGIFLAIIIFTINVSKPPSEFLSKLLGICASALTYGLFGAMCYSIFSKNNTQQFSMIAIGICTLGFIVNSIGILVEVKDESFAKSIFTLFIMSIALAQIAMLYKINIVNRYAAISRIIAVVSIAIFSFMVIILIWGNLAELQYKFMGANIAAIKGYLALLCIDIAFTAATPLLNKFEEGRYEEENIAADFLKDTETAQTVPVE